MRVFGFDQAGLLDEVLFTDHGQPDAPDAGTMLAAGNLLQKIAREFWQSSLQQNSKAIDARQGKASVGGSGRIESKQAKTDSSFTTGAPSWTFAGLQDHVFIRILGQHNLKALVMASSSRFGGAVADCLRDLHHRVATITKHIRQAASLANDEDLTARSQPRARKPIAAARASKPKKLQHRSANDTRVQRNKPKEEPNVSAAPRQDLRRAAKDIPDAQRRQASSLHHYLQEAQLEEISGDDCSESGVTEHVDNSVDLEHDSLDSDDDESDSAASLDIVPTSNPAPQPSSNRRTNSTPDEASAIGAIENQQIHAVARDGDVLRRLPPRRSAAQSSSVGLAIPQPPVLSIEAMVLAAREAEAAAEAEADRAIAELLKPQRPRSRRSLPLAINHTVYEEEEEEEEDEEGREEEEGGEEGEDDYDLAEGDEDTLMARAQESTILQNNSSLHDRYFGSDDDDDDSSFFSSFS